MCIKMGNYLRNISLEIMFYQQQQYVASEKEVFWDVTVVVKVKEDIDVRQLNTTKENNRLVKTKPEWYHIVGELKTRGSGNKSNYPHLIYPYQLLWQFIQHWCYQCLIFLSLIKLLFFLYSFVELFVHGHLKCPFQFNCIWRLGGAVIVLVFCRKIFTFFVNIFFNYIFILYTSNCYTIFFLQKILKIAIQTG